MKKISLLVLLVFAVIVLINCGSSGDSKDDKTNEEPEEQNCEINDPDKDYIINISKSNPFDSCIEDYKTLTFIFDDIGTYQITATSTEIPYSCGDSTIEDYKYHRFPMEVVNGFDSDRSYKTPLSSALNRKFEVVNAVNSKIVMGRYLDNNKDNYNCYGDYWHEEQSIFGDVKIEFVNSNIRMGTKGNPETVTDTDFPISGKLNADSDFIDEDTSFEKGNTSTTYFYTSRNKRIYSNF
jgi:hypothetical protein